MEVRTVAKQVYGVPLERSDYLPLPAHQDSCSRERFPEWLESFGADKRFALDLFSGAGGLSLGLTRAGWTLAAAVDHSGPALETHAANFPGMSLDVDLGDPAALEELLTLLRPARGRIDLVAGGPPCQPFSRAGRSKIRNLVENHGRNPVDLRKELWRSYLRIIEEVQPRAVLMENVPDMGLSDDFRVVRFIEQRLENAGYATQVRLVDAWRYGVPQHRKRLILLARNDVEEFDWEPDQDPVTLSDAIGDLPPLLVATDEYAGSRPHILPTERVGVRRTPYTPSPTPSAFVGKMREGVEQDESEDVVWDHMTRRVRKDDWEIFSTMESDTLYSHVDESLRRYRADSFTDKYKKLDWAQRSRSITAHIAKDGYWYIHPDQNRTLTVREAARVQTFPDWFRFAGTRSDAFRQIGNAVPPLLGEAAAKVLRPGPGETPEGGLKSRWSQVRSQLDEWATQRRRSDDWVHLPGRHLSQLTAAVVALLSGTRLQQAQLEALADQLRGVKVLSAQKVDTLKELAPSPAARARMERLEAVVGLKRIWTSREYQDEVASRLEMKPSEQSLFKLLNGDDVLWIGQGALRVAARLNGSDSDRTNRLSDGRVDLVRIIGSGDNAPLRMASLRLIGNTVCQARKPACDSCPVSSFCLGQEKDSAEAQDASGGDEGDPVASENASVS
ncbi:DNA (cytosine-5-)-methyltransferase [Streptacidiphilus sp. MAP5-52]|uniref:DNA (cytosine-5-)-methyltransferase n=1 Tax=Streptacidiphilus sp. MAP5-52 TaxID=3156267 RepID=UPI0035192C00